MRKAIVLSCLLLLLSGSLCASALESGFVATEIGFADSSTPFPRTKDTSQGSQGSDGGVQVSTREAIYAYVRGAIWVTRASEGGLIFHDCLDADRLGSALATAPAGRIAAATSVGERASGLIYSTLRDVATAFEAGAPAEWSNDELTRAYQDVAFAYLDRLKLYDLLDAHPNAVLTREFQVNAGSCTTGRCDCVTCPIDRTCDCQKFDGVDECAPPRRSCNTDAPKAGRLGPSLEFGY